MWVGSFVHEAFWHGYPTDIFRRYDQLALLYGGGMPGAGKWLLSQGIDYALWYRPEDTPALWEKVNASVQPDYIWHDILTEPGPGGRRVGYWMRNPRPLRIEPSLFPWNPPPRRP
jgi:hypothetical protein